MDGYGYKMLEVEKVGNSEYCVNGNLHLIQINKSRKQHHLPKSLVVFVYSFRSLRLLVYSFIRQLKWGYAFMSNKQINAYAHKQINPSSNQQNIASF